MCFSLKLKGIEYGNKIIHSMIILYNKISLLISVYTFYRALLITSP
jgi:hypothetical protein